MLCFPEISSVAVVQQLATKAGVIFSLQLPKKPLETWASWATLPRCRLASAACSVGVILPLANCSWHLDPGQPGMEPSGVPSPQLLCRVTCGKRVGVTLLQALWPQSWSHAYIMISFKGPLSRQHFCLPHKLSSSSCWLLSLCGF